MKSLLAILALAFSFNANAVDLTVVLTTAQATRVAAACGQSESKMDAQVPPQPRACTMAEVKDAVIRFLRSKVEDQERLAATRAQQAAKAAFDPQ